MNREGRRSRAGRFMSRGNLQDPDAHWDHEPRSLTPMRDL